MDVRNRPQDHAADTTQLADDASRTFEEIEEFLRVDKREVDRGGYRITKRTTLSTETIDEALAYERVDIERQPMNRVPLAGGVVPEPRYEGETLVIPIVEEIVFTEKRLVLVEEVRITRRRGTTRHAEQVTLRKQHVDIERLDAAPPGTPSLAT